MAEGLDYSRTEGGRRKSGAEMALLMPNYLRYWLNKRIVEFSENDRNHVKWEFIETSEHKATGIVIAKVSILLPGQVRQLSPIALKIENALYDPLVEMDFKPISHRVLGKDTIRECIDGGIASDKKLSAHWKYFLD